MKSRANIIIPVVLLLTVVCVFLAGAAKRSFELTLTDGDSVVFQKSYNIRLGTRLGVMFLHRNSYGGYFDGLQDRSDAASELNERLYADIDGAAGAMEYPAKDASVSWDGKSFSYTPEQNGVAVDRAEIVAGIFSHMDKKIVLNIAKKTLYPSVTESDLRAITVETGSFSTEYAASADTRKHNIALAVSLIDGAVIGAGEKFSFNTQVGDRTVERGFLEAKIISDGKFVKGVGGGVCQVSTTLYNAALRAGLSVIKVTNHSLPVHYVPLSFDAMVSSRSDLILENTTGHPVYIRGESDGKTLKFTFFGADVYKDRELIFRTEIKKIISKDEYEDIPDSSQLIGGEPYKVLVAPKEGYVSEAYLDIFQNGKLLSSTLLRRDTYLPQKGLRIVPDRITDETGELPFSGVAAGSFIYRKLCGFILENSR